MNILLSYLEVDTLEAAQQDLEGGLFYEIDRHSLRGAHSVRKPNAIRRRIDLIKAELDRRRKQPYQFKGD